MMVAAAMNAAWAATPSSLDPSLEPPADQEAAPVFRDMGVVQKKAMTKEGRLLFSSFFTLDFSDGPYTNYSVNVSPGYAISDFFEVYANFVPLFIFSPRSIVKKVERLRLDNGYRAQITATRPTLQYGIEAIWAPLYGKDSVGLRTIIRSDTFLKFGIYQVKYGSESGMKFVGGVGKTFFLGDAVGIRLAATTSYWQQIIDNKKNFEFLFITETGLVLYF